MFLCSSSPVLLFIVVLGSVCSGVGSVLVGCSVLWFFSEFGCLSSACWVAGAAAGFLLAFWCCLIASGFFLVSLLGCICSCFLVLLVWWFFFCFLICFGSAGDFAPLFRRVF